MVVVTDTWAAHVPRGVSLPPNSVAPAIAARLANHTEARRLHFPVPGDVWGGFDDPAVEAAFDRRFTESLVSWCCHAGPGGSRRISYAEFMARDEQHALSLAA